MADIRRRLATLAVALIVGACSGALSPPSETFEDDEPNLLDTFEPDEPPIEETANPVAGPDDGIGRPTTVDVTITGTPGGQADGHFRATAKARFCGQVSFLPDGFTYEFPLDGDYNPEDVTFGAELLHVGSSTSTFNVSAAVYGLDGGHPPIVGMNPGARYGDTGTATLAEEDGTTILTVDAATEHGEHLLLIATCEPGG